MDCGQGDIIFSE